MTKEDRREYAQAVGVAAAHSATEPWRVLTAVTNDAARSLGKRVAERSGAAEHAVGQTLDLSRDPSTGDLCIDVNDGGDDPRDTDSHAGQPNNESVSSIKTQSGDLGTVAEGTHSEVNKDVILRLETLTVRETKKPMEEPFWKEIVPFFQQLSRRELDMFPGHPWAHGWKYTTVICDSQLYMQYLRTQFIQAGGSVQQRKINDLSEIAQDFDLVVNCAGLGSQELFKDDKLTPVRGQVIRVRAPWVKNYMNNNGQFYIIPNFETVVLGGTTQKGNYDTTISPQDRERIMEGCCKMVPSLRHAEVVSEWAGLRPARDRVLVSLEYQQVTTVNGQVKSLPVVHNYGHGGAGITLHWGCAADAVDLAKQHLEHSHASKL